MPTLEDYRRDPCRAASLPWWKLPLYPPTSQLFGLHESEVSPDEQRPHERYFRLIHRLQAIPTARAAADVVLLDPVRDVDHIVSLINQSYDTIAVNSESVERWRSTAVFAPDLWRGVWIDGQLAAAVIADLDPTVPEASVEWVQVLPAHRGHGLALALLVDVLHACVGRADFVTVAGDCANSTDPRSLYLRAGFAGDDVWCIFRS